ncbi:MAG: hypothetical protein PHO26_10055 [Dehalococcoidia bacterium]|nr:hypothetical protein [Dehalococcoidia bacterium]MDD5494279.1 hypothetical protein [Dehalococcoidia bacterium]
MTTLSSIRTLVRRDLKDEDSVNYRWTDDEIDRAVEKAVLDYSEYCPMQVRSVLATVDGSQDIDISGLTDRIDVLQVEHPVDESLRQFHPFRVWADILTFQGGYEGDGENCYVYWLQKHSITAQSSTIPSAHEGIIALGASAYAISSQAQYKSDMANTGGPNVDKDYNFWAKEKFKQFYDSLQRVKNYNPNKLKVIQLLPEE